jgi:ArsR family transcriptional regulator
MIAQKIWQQAETYAGYCSLFGNPRRILILWLLQDRERSVSSLAAELGISLQNTSQNLRLMKDKGVLQARREGQVVYYRLAKNDLLCSCGLINLGPPGCA